MLLNKSLWLVFMLFPVFVLANEEFNSVIEDFDQYWALQKQHKSPVPHKPHTSRKHAPRKPHAPHKPRHTKPKPQKCTVPSVSKTGRVNPAQPHATTTSTSNSKTAPKVLPTPSNRPEQAKVRQSQSVNAVRSQEILERDKGILADIKKQNYLQYDDNLYFKFLKQGPMVPSIEDKIITFTLHEELTDGTVTKDYGKANPIVIAYPKLPVPLNLLIEKAGKGGKFKVYIKPGVENDKTNELKMLSPKSMSILTVEVLEVK